jgi:hypothetical protein
MAVVGRIMTFQCCRVERYVTTPLCPECGKHIDESREKQTCRKGSVAGIRNYFDEGMGIHIRDPKHKREEMRKRGFALNSRSGGSWESNDPPLTNRGERITLDHMDKATGFVKPEFL